jgi:hypothetical protein
MEGTTVTPKEIVGVCARLPGRQREALTLHGAEHLSYEEIAVRMDTSPGSVAQLISRARINLYDELRGTALASVAPPSPECEQALPLIVAREDGQLEAVSGDPAWLDAHLAGCERCRLGMEQMREAEAAYLAGVSIASAGEALAKASPAPGPPSASTAAPLPVSSRTGLPRSRAVLVGALAALLLLGGLAAAFIRDAGAPTPDSSAADAAPAQGNARSDSEAKAVNAGDETRGAAKGKAKTSSTASDRSAGSRNSAAAATPTPLTVPVQATSGGGARSEPVSGSTGSSGKAGVKPTQQTSAPKPASKPKPAPTAMPTSQPASEPATTPTTEAPPAEEPSDAPGRSGEAPGKPPGHPRH